MRRIVPRLCARTLLAATVAMAPRLSAQTAAARTPEQIRASYDAHQAEFDYLLGDWEFTAESREYGSSRGYWSAVRLTEGQILDEYRIVGDSGETYYVTTTLRAYNAVLDRWELIGMDAGNGLQDVGTARRVGAEMHLEQKFGVMSPTPSLWRIRYYDIRPDRFSWTADRSTDGGKTWGRNHLRIEARRIGPPRSLGPLAPARNAAAGSGGAAAAQQTDDAAATRRSFAEVSGWVAEAAELVPADKYAYRPTASVRTFGQLIAHIADSYNYYCALAGGRNVQWSDPIEQGGTDKATLKRQLEQARASCEAAYGGAGQPRALVDNIGHTNLHYGNIITYMRLLGLVPPSS